MDLQGGREGAIFGGTGLVAVPESSQEGGPGGCCCHVGRQEGQGGQEAEGAEEARQEKESEEEDDGQEAAELAAIANRSQHSSTND
jgi:hypothetical protein